MGLPARTLPRPVRRGIFFYRIDAGEPDKRGKPAFIDNLAASLRVTPCTRAISFSTAATVGVIRRFNASVLRSCGFTVSSPYRMLNAKHARRGHVATAGVFAEFNIDISMYNGNIHMVKIATKNKRMINTSQ